MNNPYGMNIACTPSHSATRRPWASSIARLEEHLQRALPSRSLLSTVAVAVVACAGAFFSSPAHSQTEPSASGALDEIVVTAEKRSSTVQSTPFSLTALSGSQLVEQGLGSIEDVASLTPGISMKQFAPGQTEYEMRGLPSAGGSSATVGLYLDEVPMAAPAGSLNGKAMIDPDLYDLERVEVLRGPQGTLYGAGSMGGTIRLITASPEFNKFEASSQTILSGTEHGGFNRGESAMLNLPIVDDRLAVRLVGTYKYDDGWIDRIVVSPFPIGPGGECGYATCTRGDVQAAPVVKKYTNSNFERLSGGRASVRFQATDDLSVDLKVMYQGISTGAFPQVDQSAGLTALSHYEPFDIADPFEDTFKVYSLGINYDMGFATLTSDTAKWLHESSWVSDFSEQSQYLFNAFYGLSTLFPVTYRNADHTEQLSQELRLTSEGNSPWQWLVGAFFSRFESILDQYAAAPTYAEVSTGGPAANPTGIGYQVYDPYHITQYALFAESSYKITDTLKATVGVRVFKFDTHLDFEQAGVFAQTGNATRFTGAISGSASGANPKFNLSYQPHQNLTLYTEIAKGFRPGGVNLPVPVPPCQQKAPASYSPDSIWNYEAGEKARLFDGRLTVNADAFYIHWNDVQQLLTLPCSFPYTNNVGTGESYGPELEITAAVTPEFWVSVNGSYTQAHLTSINPSLLGNTIGAVEHLEPGVPLLNVPRYQLSGSLNYSAPIFGDYKWTGRLSATTTGPSHDINYYVQEIPGYTIADARLGIVGGPWGAYLFAHNLANKIAILTVDTNAWSAPTPALSTPAVTTPRTVGIEINYKY
jgi:iron complex outermembrane receptor protein